MPPTPRVPARGALNALQQAVRLASSCEAQGGGEALHRHTPASFAASRPSEIHLHYYMMPPGAAGLVAPGRPTHHSPRSLLPFIGGACFGALGLAAWQSAHADSMASARAAQQQPGSLSALQQAPVNLPHDTVTDSPQQAWTAPSASNAWHTPGGGSGPWACTHGTATTHAALTATTGATSRPGPWLWQAVSWPWGGLWPAGKGATPPNAPAPDWVPGAAHPSSALGPTLPRSMRDPYRTSHGATPPHAGAPSAATPALERPPPFRVVDEVGATPAGGLVAGPAHGAGPAAPDHDSSGYWAAPLTRGAIATASATAAPAVVHLVVGDERDAPSSLLPSAHLPHRPRASSGSGFVYDPRGYILTNAHVVACAAATSSPLPDAGGDLGSCRHGSHVGASAGAADGAMLASHGRNSLTITMHDGRVLKGRVVAMDSVSDVAVVKAELPPGEVLPYCVAGRSARLRVGEWVVALGTPLMLKQSVTAGIVSCVERRGSELGLEGARNAYIQTDAAINQGNSGGPLVNLEGQVVGMSVFKAVAADGVSFAIPMDSVREVVRQFHEHGRVIRPYVGITMVEVTNGALKQLQASIPQLANATAAVMLQAVRDGSPAQLAGLAPEDILVTLDGRAGLGMSEAVEAFGRSVGRPVACGVIRRSPGPGGGHTLLTINVTPAEAAA